MLVFPLHSHPFFIFKLYKRFDFFIKLSILYYSIYNLKLLLAVQEENLFSGDNVELIFSFFDVIVVNDFLEESVRQYTLYTFISSTSTFFIITFSYFIKKYSQYLLNNLIIIFT
jgi:hypothetical protein